MEIYQVLNGVYSPYINCLLTILESDSKFIGNRNSHSISKKYTLNQRNKTVTILVFITGKKIQSYDIISDRYNP